MQVDDVKLSAVVCTHDRLSFLPSCLKSLRDQTCDRSAYEVIVVDSASSDGTSDWAREFCKKGDGFLYLRENRLGLSVARNRGQQSARGRYVAYIDDDAQAAPDWVERLIAGFEQEESPPDAVGGEIDPVWGTEPPSWMNELFVRFLAAGLHWSEEPLFLKPPQWICEVNSAYRREVLERFGPWPEDLGRKGSNLLSNENLINQKIFASGGRIYFDPRVRVRHYIHPDRLTKTWMRRRHFWQGISEAVIVAHHPEVGWPDRLDRGELPSSSEDWVALFTDDTSDAGFRLNCHRIYQLGYFLQINGLIHGR